MWCLYEYFMLISSTQKLNPTNTNGFLKVLDAFCNLVFFCYISKLTGYLVFFTYISKSNKNNLLRKIDFIKIGQELVWICNHHKLCFCSNETRCKIYITYFDYIFFCSFSKIFIWFWKFSISYLLLFN